MTADVTLRDCTLADLLAALAIQRESAEAPQWSEAVWRALLQRADDTVPMRSAVAAVHGESVLGFLVLKFVDGEAEIESLAVAGSSRRRGLGAALCRHAMEWSVQHSAQRLVLEVRSRNAAALALYASLGFQKQGFRKDYYRHPPDDAVLFGMNL